MTRNLDHRVEILFPIQDEKLHEELYNILSDYFRDNCQASVLNNEGKWTRITPPDGEQIFRVQKEMLARAARDSENTGPVKLEYTVRRSPPADGQQADGQLVDLQQANGQPTNK